MVNRKLDTHDAVFFYEQEFYALSNFSAFRLFWEGIDFDTSEHAYHWEKFPCNQALRHEIKEARSAHDAFKIAEKNKPWQRGDWAEVRVAVMRAILKAKVEQHEYVKRKLLQTGSRLLVEDSWRDSFWGWGEDGEGENMLGWLWSEIRYELSGGRKLAPSTASAATRPS